MYCLGMNAALLLTEAYDQALRDHDVLIMPTLPTTAKPLPKEGTSIKGVTSPFDIKIKLDLPCLWRYESGETIYTLHALGRFSVYAECVYLFDESSANSEQFFGVKQLLTSYLF